MPLILKSCCKFWSFRATENAWQLVNLVFTANRHNKFYNMAQTSFPKICLLAYFIIEFNHKHVSKYLFISMKVWKLIRSTPILNYIGSNHILTCMSRCTIYKISHKRVQFKANLFKSLFPQHLFLVQFLSEFFQLL